MKTLRWFLLGLGGVLVLLLVLLASLLIAGWNTIHATESNPLAPLRVAPDAALYARGEHLVLTNCVGCHGENYHGPLAGSKDDFFAGKDVPPLGRLYAPNLTPAGRLKDYSDEALARTIREGVDRDDHPLVVMPSAQMRGLSDRDLAAIITYLRRQSPVEHVVPSRQLTPLAYLFVGLHMLETSHQLPVTVPVPDVPEAMTATYGGYLLPYLGCRDCHGADLRGGKQGQLSPVGPELLKLVSTHDLETFTLSVRAGVSAGDGHVMDSEKMPYPSYARLSDTEVGALYTYLQSLGRKPS